MKLKCGDFSSAPGACPSWGWPDTRARQDLYLYRTGPFGTLPLPTANTLHGIAYGNGRFVAVGYQTLTFPDGLGWTTPKRAAR